MIIKFRDVELSGTRKELSHILWLFWKAQNELESECAFQTAEELRKELMEIERRLSDEDPCRA